MMLDWSLHHTLVRQDQVTELVLRVRELGRGTLTVVCDVFSATPDCNKVRLLAGRATGAGVCWHSTW
ncbi:hypothetical protein ACWEF6_21270 [Amycolatopsis sp. NPDC004772]